MPEYTPLAKVPIPLRTEVDDMSAILKAAFTAVDSLYVLRAATTADRDAKYADVPAGTIVTGTDVDAIWRKKKDGTWAEIWSDTGWTEVTLLDGFIRVSNNSAVAWRRIGTAVYWRGTLRPPDSYPGSAYIRVCNVPAQAMPKNALRVPCSGNTGTAASLLITDGELRFWANTATGAYFSPPPSYLID